MNKVIGLVLVCFIFFSQAPSLAVDRSLLGSDIDGEAASNYYNIGWSVSLSSAGDRAAIGSHWAGPTYSEGMVRIYEYSPAVTNWIQVGSDFEGGYGEELGFSVSLSSAGDRVAIGAPDQVHWTGNNHVRIYEYSPAVTNWVQLGTNIDGEGSFDASGWSVSLSSAGDRVAIGAPYNNDSGKDAGHVRIYEYSPAITNWIQVGSDIDGNAKDDLFGYSVSLSADGDRVAIGARNNSDNTFEAGQVRIFEYSPAVTNWIQLGSNIDGLAATNHFGSSVSLCAAGNRVAAGAPRHNAGGDSAGQVRIYEYSPAVTNWIQMGSDINGKAAGDLAAITSLSDSGDRVAIGAPDETLTSAGHVYIYEYSGGDWIQLDSDIAGEAPGDLSGGSVSLSSTGDRVAIGAIFNDDGGVNAGHARVYGDIAVDTDGDGLCDALEAHYSTDLADVDTDDDGETDSAEVFMGFNPTNQWSNLDFTGWPTNDSFKVSFMTATGRLFYVESKDSLLQSNWVERISLSGTGTSTNWMEPSMDSNEFYRIKVQIQ